MLPSSSHDIQASICAEDGQEHAGEAWLGSSEQQQKKSHWDKDTQISSQDEALPEAGYPCSSQLHQSWTL